MDSNTDGSVEELMSEMTDRLTTDLFADDFSSYKALLPTMIHKGRPLSMQNHFPMLPFFKRRRPRKTVFMCGRQLGKSISLGASDVFRSRIIGNYDVLNVQPRYEQIKRFSTLYVGPMLKNSPLSSWYIDDTRESSIMQRCIGGGGTLHYAYAFLTPDATRGYSVNELNVDEAQDIQSGFLDVIEEVLSAQTEYAFSVYSGTPKSEENTLSALFRSGSQGFVHIRCDHCNYENIANKENHIYKMIGKKSCICAKCGRALNLLKIRFVHHNRSMRSRVESYHISQVTHPLHAYHPEKWSELVDKLNNPDYSEVTFENEILGLPSDHNETPLTEAELRDACDPDMANSLPSAKRMCDSAPMKVMGVDWSGFGQDQTSTTVAVVACTKPGDDRIFIPYVERVKEGDQAEAEAVRIRHLFNTTRCDFFAHDFSGAGVIREALISQMGIKGNRFVPFAIVHAPVRHRIISFYKPSDGGRACYNIDKTRSLMVLYQMIKKGKVVFPRWEDAKSVLSDLLNIMHETHSNPRGGDFVIMERIPGTSDDCAHAINFACSAIWHRAGKYPNIAPQLQSEFEPGFEEEGELHKEMVRERLVRKGITPSYA